VPVAISDSSGDAIASSRLFPNATALWMAVHHNMCDSRSPMRWKTAGFGGNGNNRATVLKSAILTISSIVPVISRLPAIVGR
jgi:hypothetical protein